jgi:hypothetical protein
MPRYFVRPVFLLALVTASAFGADNSTGENVVVRAAG